MIFPVDYWPLLQKYAKERGLDPYRGRRAGRAGIEFRSGRASRTPTPTA